eukprot:Hpha_TRINITY_DN8729_c0_g1::TRINITY_DN8729_c0_g1_i1::g.45370::m.45370
MISSSSVDPYPPCSRIPIMGGDGDVPVGDPWPKEGDGEMAWLRFAGLGLKSPPGPHDPGMYAVGTGDSARGNSPPAGGSGVSKPTPRGEKQFTKVSGTPSKSVRMRNAGGKDTAGLRTGDTIFLLFLFHDSLSLKPLIPFLLLLLFAGINKVQK